MEPTQGSARRRLRSKLTVDFIGTGASSPGGATATGGGGSSQHAAAASPPRMPLKAGHVRYVTESIKTFFLSSSIG